MSYKKRIYIIFTIIAILITSIVTIENSHSAPNAFLDGCEKMGAGMDREHPGNSLNKLSGAEDSSRKWTVEELFRRPINFSNYYGEGESTLLYANKVDRGLVRPWITEDIWNAPGVQEKLESARTPGCLVARMNAIPQLALRTSSGISWLASLMTGSLLGEDFMVSGLLDLIGGDGESDGLIGTFFNSIYMPLVVIAFVLMAGTLVYKGLIQMKLREALTSIIWSTLAFVIGVTLMFNPRMMAEIPQKATSVVTTCVLGALNGQNCLTNDVTTPELLTDIECLSDTSSNDTSTVDMMINGMNCTIWKTFVLEPWAEEQFGVPYNQLYTKNEPAGGSIWANLPEGQENLYCVNLESSRPASQMMNSDVIVDGGDDNTVCNVALYQLYLQTEMHDEVNHASDRYQLTTPSDGASYDARWFDIIVPMANDDSNWKYWAGPGRFMGRTASAAMGVIAISLAGAVLITLGILGAVYKLTGVIMMAFAPLFLLFAIEPNRGRRIFLGWLETLISSILKYFAIAMLLVVSLMLYAGILNNTSGPASFISIIILTVALMLYRKEITDLIGATNMGGQRLTNQVAKKAEGAKKQIKQKGSAYVGGRIGGRAGAAASRKEEIKARKDTISTLQEKLANATSSEEEIELRSQIKAEEDGLSSIGAGQGHIARTRDLLLGPKEEGKTRLDVAKQAVKDDWNKGKTLREGASAGGKDSLNRAMRRGTSMTAAAFRQKSATQSSINRDFDAERDKVDKEAQEYVDKATKAGQERIAKIVDTSEQRESIKYKGVLSQEERDTLDNFANQLATIPENDALLNEANMAKESGDENRTRIVANEINARIRHNSIHGLKSKELARSPLAESKYLLDSELTWTTNAHLEDYVKTGDKEYLDLYSKNKLELKNRKIDKDFLEPEYIEKHRESLKGKLDEFERGEKIHQNNAEKSGKLKDDSVPESLKLEREKLIKKGIIKEEEEKEEVDMTNKINEGSSRRNEGSNRKTEDSSRGNEQNRGPSKNDDTKETKSKGEKIKDNNDNELNRNKQSKKTERNTKDDGAEEVKPRNKNNKDNNDNDDGPSQGGHDGSERWEDEEVNPDQEPLEEKDNTEPKQETTKRTRRTKRQEAIRRSKGERYRARRQSPKRTERNPGELPKLD